MPSPDSLGIPADDEIVTEAMDLDDDAIIIGNSNNGNNSDLPCTMLSAN